MPNEKKSKIKIGFISLGCDKNRLDTEYMIAALKNDGYAVTNDKDAADIIVVNTCGFIDCAKTESVDAVLEAAALKKNGLKKLIVTGCFAERYGGGLLKKIPEADAVLGVGAYDTIRETVEKILEGERVLNLEKNTYDFKERVVTTPFHYAYLRIADGCDNRCSYCAIPYIKGAYRSRTFESIGEELKKLKESYDIKELILVAQDVTRYGVDIYGEYGLLKLLDLIEGYGFPWVRLLYCYPELVTDELIRAVGERRGGLCKYLDIPLQHVNDGVLRSMNRRNDGAYARRLIDRIRNIDGGISVRSTFITGYPTETEADFEELCRFISDYKLDNAGFFTFSKEEGTAAARLKDLHYRTKRRRRDTLRAIQADVMAEKNKSRIGGTDLILYEGVDYEKGFFYGRNQFNAPDIDTLVYLESDIPLDVGKFYTAEIIGAVDGIDLKARVTDEVFL
ncbi:MAG: 30S ribosomal protein S12 methylthiotransferase RimO [Clostridiales bacterium]|jgi:ribosomal protein S12 methylthiotransferase|nr:30S ribosomal protein S12 methylthiotransferase RimO [Clostridiales bacterium]